MAHHFVQKNGRRIHGQKEYGDTYEKTETPVRNQLISNVKQLSNKFVLRRTCSKTEQAGRQRKEERRVSNGEIGE